MSVPSEIVRQPSLGEIDLSKSQISLRGALMLKKQASSVRVRQPGSRRTSSVSEPRLNPPRKENTFRLEPEQKERFNPQAVKSVSQESMHLFLANTQKYNSQKCSQVARYIAEDIKGRVKKLGYKRYKIVTQVVIGSIADQDLRVTSKCLWDSARDNMATTVFKNSSVYAVATVYGIYYE